MPAWIERALAIWGAFSLAVVIGFAAMLVRTIRWFE
jgi:hypothetical protein